VSELPHRGSIAGKEVCMVTVQAPRRFADLFPPLGPRTLRRAPETFAVRPYDRFNIRPLGPTVGVEIDGVDLANPLSDEVVTDLHRALLEWKLLFFRAPAIDLRQFYAFARYFGDTFDDSTMGQQSQVTRDSQTPNVGVGKCTAEQNYWHADATYGKKPPRATVLRVQPPAVGGDTLFADMAAAYDNLPDEVKTRIEPLTAIHDVDRYARSFHPTYTTETSRWPPVEHPVVIAHPKTGRKTLYVNSQWTRELVGLEPEEGDPLLMYLCAQVSVPEYQCRLSWQPSGLGIWDGYAVQHYAVGDYTAGRSFWRTTIAGEFPTAPGA
jgi:taurine dioxygenase